MSVRHFVVTIRAVFDAIVDFIDPYLGTIHAIEPVDFITITVVLLFICTIRAVSFAIVYEVEWNLFTISTNEVRVDDGHAVVVRIGHLILTIRAVFDAIVDFIDPYLGTIHAIEPVDFITITVVLLFICTIRAVSFAIVYEVEWNLFTISTNECNLYHRMTASGLTFPASVVW